MVTRPAAADPSALARPRALFAPGHPWVGGPAAEAGDAFGGLFETGEREVAVGDRAGGSGVDGVVDALAAGRAEAQEVDAAYPGEHGGARDAPAGDDRRRVQGVADDDTAVAEFAAQDAGDGRAR